MKKAIKNWLIVIASLLDDVAVTLLILLLLLALGVSISPVIYILLAALFVASTFVTYRLVTPALGLRQAAGREAMIGARGEAVNELNPIGMVRVAGELWQAQSTQDNIAAGATVEVIEVRRLTLLVRRVGQ